MKSYTIRLRVEVYETDGGKESEAVRMLVDVEATDEVEAAAKLGNYLTHVLAHRPGAQMDVRDVTGATTMGDEADPFGLSETCARCEHVAQVHGGRGDGCLQPGGCSCEEFINERSTRPEEETL